MLEAIILPVLIAAVGVQEDAGKPVEPQPKPHVVHERLFDCSFDEHNVYRCIPDKKDR